MFARFTVTWLIILGVATYDTYLTAKHGAVIDEMECNPVGAYLMTTAGGVPLFVGLKTAGVGLSLLFAFALWQCERLRTKVLRASYVVAAFQIGLFGFLETDWVAMQIRDLTRDAEQQADLARVHNASLPIALPDESNTTTELGIFQAASVSVPVAEEIADCGWRIAD